MFVAFVCAGLMTVVNPPNGLSAGGGGGGGSYVPSGWQVQYRPQGSYYGNYTAPDPLNPTGDWDLSELILTGKAYKWSDYWGATGATYGWSAGVTAGAPSDPATAASSGQIQAAFKWVSGTDQAPTPPGLYVHLSASASVLSRFDQDTFSLDNDVEPGIPVVTVGAGNGTNYESRSMDGGLVALLQPSGSTTEDFLSQLVTLMAGGDTDTVGNLTVSAMCTFEADPLPTPYILSSLCGLAQGIWDTPPGANYHKGPDGSRVQNVPGFCTMTADAAVSYIQFPYPNPPQWDGQVDYCLYQQLFNSPASLVWVDTGQQLAGSYPNTEYTADYRYAVDWTSLALGKTSHTAVSVTDVDPANPVVNVFYNVNWHYPYENWSVLAKSPDYFGPPIGLSIPNPGYCIPLDGSLACTWNDPSILWGDSAKTWDLSTTLLDAPPFQVLSKVVGYAISALTPEPDHGTCSGLSATWDSAIAVYDEGYPLSSWVLADASGRQYTTTVPPPPPSDWTDDEWRMQFTMVPLLEPKYNDFTVTADAYSRDGYDGQTIRYVHMMTNHLWQGIFTEQNNGNINNPPPE